MLREIHLHGALAGLRDGPLAVHASTAWECWRACEALVPGFAEAVAAHGHGLLVETDAGPVAPAFRSWPLEPGQRVVRILPYAEGAGVGDWFKWVDPALNWVLSSLGIIDSDEGERGDGKPSDLFDGPVSTASEGGAVPVVYGGPVRVGPIVISAGIANSADGRSQLARIVDVLCEGEIEGLATKDGGSVFIADTQVGEFTPWKQGGQSQFQDGLTVDFRTGVLDPGSAPGGFAATETDTAVNEALAELDRSHTVIRQVQNANTDRVRVVVRWQSMIRTSGDGGKRGTGTPVIIETDTGAGGAWQGVAGSPFNVEGQTASPFEREWEFAVAKGARPRIRVRGLNPSTTSGVRRIDRNASWARLTEIASLRQDYRRTALAALSIPSERQADLGDRAYEIKGKKVQVPSNYDGAARTSAGQWDGAFKPAAEWTSNPAWCLYDLLRNRRYGLGRYIPEAALAAARFDFAKAAAFCDAKVADGKGGTEHRYSLHCVLEKRDDAIKVLTRILSAMDCELYDLGGELRLAQRVWDAQQGHPPLVSNANAKDGRFAYASAVRERYSAVQVSFNDPENGYRLSTELVVDNALVQRYGHRTKSIAAFGCTSRGQAARAGRHFLIGQEHEGDTVTYTAGADHASVRPGQVIRLLDEHVAGERLFARVVAARANNTSDGRKLQLEVDQVPPSLAAATGPDAYDGWTVRWLDAGFVTRSAGIHATGVRGNKVNTDLADSRYHHPPAGGVVLFEHPRGQAREFRIQQVERRDGRRTEARITAQAFHRGRYAAAEAGLKLTTPQYILQAQALPRPASAALSEELEFGEGLAVRRSLLASAAATGLAGLAWEFQVREPGSAAWAPLGLHAEPLARLGGPAAGEWRLRARTARGGQRGAWREAPAYTVAALETQTVYRLTQGAAPGRPASTDAQRGQAAYVPAGWSAARPAVSTQEPALWQSQRMGLAALGWGEWTEPAEADALALQAYQSSVTGRVKSWLDRDANGSHTATVTVSGGLLQHACSVDWRVNFWTDSDTIRWPLDGRFVNGVNAAVRAYSRTFYSNVPAATTAQLLDFSGFVYDGATGRDTANTSVDVLFRAERSWVAREEGIRAWVQETTQVQVDGSPVTVPVAEPFAGAGK